MKRLLFAMAATAAVMFSTAAIYADDTKPAEKPKEAPKETPKEEPKTEEKAPEFATVDQLAPTFTLKDANGKEQKLADYLGKIVVLEWVNYDCPIVVRHYSAGHMQALQKEIRDAGGVWLSICSSAKDKQGYFEGEALTNRVKKEKADAGFYLIDADGKTGKTYKATNTPHMYVIDAKGKLRYAGAIDDNPKGKGDEIAKAKNYVREAFTAVKDGKEVATKTAKAYGCNVKYVN